MKPRRLPLHRDPWYWHHRHMRHLKNPHVLSDVGLFLIAVAGIIGLFAIYAQMLKGGV